MQELTSSQSTLLPSPTLAPHVSTLRHSKAQSFPQTVAQRLAERQPKKQPSPQAFEHSSFASQVKEQWSSHTAPQRFVEPQD